MLRSYKTPWTNNHSYLKVFRQFSCHHRASEDTSTCNCLAHGILVVVEGGTSFRSCGCYARMKGSLKKGRLANMS